MIDDGIRDSKLTFNIDGSFTLISRTSSHLGVEDAVAEEATQLHQRPARPRHPIHGSNHPWSGVSTMSDRKSARRMSTPEPYIRQYLSNGASLFDEKRETIPSTRANVDRVIRIRAEDASVTLACICGAEHV
jgi:hypothetical protein